MLTRPRAFRLSLLVLMSACSLACRSDIEARSATSRPNALVPAETSPTAAKLGEAKPAVVPGTRIPFIQQATKFDCGAAAIAMTLHVYGRPTDLDAAKRTMKAMNVDPDTNEGMSGLDLVNFAKRSGLGAAGLKLDAADVKYLRTGDILWFGFNHFVVFDRAELQTIHIVDPGKGPQVLDLPIFSAEFTGVALVFAASPDEMERRKREIGL